MKPDRLDVFSVRDRRIRSGDLAKVAREGKLSILTKRGKPEAVTLPFGKRLLELGVDKDIAVHLFERKIVTLAKAAKIAGLPLDEFIELIGQVGLVAVDYPPAELDAEMKVKI